MSYSGIRRFAEVLSMMQSIRGELLNSRGKDTTSKSYHQDLKLAHLLDEMKDYAKEKFSEITMEKI